MMPTVITIAPAGPLRFAVRASFSEEFREFCAAVRGRWNPSLRCWEFDRRHAAQVRQALRRCYEDPVFDRRQEMPPAVVRGTLPATLIQPWRGRWRGPGHYQPLFNGGAAEVLANKPLLTREPWEARHRVTDESDSERSAA